VLIHEATFGNDDVERLRDWLSDRAAGGGGRGGSRGVAARAHARLAALLRPELLQEARDVFDATVLPRDFDTIEVPFRERGEPVLVKAGARPARHGGEGTPEG
jgi:ribonuclease Z